MSAVFKLRADPPAPAADVLSSLGRFMREHGGSLEFGNWSVYFHEFEDDIGDFDPVTGGIPVEIVGSFVAQKGYDRTNVHRHETVQEALAFALEQEGWV